MQAQLRSAVKRVTPLHETGRTVLLRTFREADDGGGALDTREFVAACAALGVQVPDPNPHPNLRVRVSLSPNLSPNPGGQERQEGAVKSTWPMDLCVLRYMFRTFQKGVVHALLRELGLGLG